MRALLERFIISSTPAWRVLLALCAATPFFFIVLLAHGWALSTPEVKAGLHPLPMWLLQGVLAVAMVLNVGLGVWLWPRRHWPDPVPGPTQLACLVIGGSYTGVTLVAGPFTAAPNLILMGILAIGLLLFERRPVLIAYGVSVVMILVQDTGALVGWWRYAPALRDQVVQAGQPVWWFWWWRQLVLGVGFIVMLGLLLILFERLDQLHTKLRRLSNTDGLTGLANRRRAMEVLHNEVARQGRTGQHLSLILIDADHFKQVNDAHGHDMGDKVLRAIGRLMLGCVRSPTDVACRLGGEEFAFILPDTRLAQAETVCARLRARMAQMHFGEGDTSFKVTLSMGVVEGRVQAVEQLLHEADQQLYLAKSTGRDRVCLAEPAGGAP